MHNHTPGFLSWGIKGSFRDYLSRQADFSLTVADHASIGPGNVVRFPLREGNGTAEWTGAGLALFVAHGGMMRLSLKNPVIKWSGSNLVIAFEFGAGINGTDHFDVARLEEVPSDDPTRTYKSFLLPDAVGMFNEMYAPDSELDAVTVTPHVTHQ